MENRLLDLFFFAPVADRLRSALQIHRDHGRWLLQDGELAHHLGRLRESAWGLSDHMTIMDMGGLCSRCAASGGGCCSLYMSGETDTMQMLMNLLAGVRVEQVEDDGEHCCFLGRKGCLFLFKPVFCLNYNCRTITAGAAPGSLGELERLSGRLLCQQYVAEQRLLELIASSPDVCREL